MATQSTDPLIGRLIDGRYQVRSRIARGGMATVYLATDLRLERRVAIKVMHGHLADDSQYKARFIQEARSAARLAHPNVVNVYDQGQDGETAYLVMEYLPGITLRDLLQEHKVLTTVQAMDIMEAILAGLAAAHKNGIVHRDLKPENVLLADDGRIKIGDFGLARAATANTATGNALLGTIAYLSPELVTRGVADTRSDIYAVGIMLYEMLAGEQPFKGEQAFQIAHQHANDTVPTPSTKNGKVPAELDELVLWATARDPDQRPRDARVMLEQLHETEALLRSDDPATAATSVHRTTVMPTALAGTGPTAETQILGGAKQPNKGRHRTGPIVAESVTALAATSEKRRSRGWWLFGLVILLAALAGGTGWYFGPGPGGQVTVPELSGQTREQATAQLQQLGLGVDPQVGSTPSITVNSGLVADTNPGSGSHVVRDGRVKLLISSGPKILTVPALAGQTEQAAKDAITSGKFSYDAKDSTRQFDATVPKGTVIAAHGTGDLDLSQGGQYGQKQPISLVVSVGAVPDVAGKPLANAQAALKEVDLTGSTGRQDYSDTVDKGNVIAIDVPSGTVLKPGDSVSLIVSNGPEPVAVPNVIGNTWAVAQKTLKDAGFSIKFANPISQFLSAAPLNATVKSISPGAGQTVDKGSEITVALQAG
ncbi:Stk1 family PASTA domain-containing Ser/Thr kinase [Lacisediminihabitans changchengi]|uniref:non-specific serine/threonine protein kinase n=1 Tax=Lacisediminihabitans changchengi TaxID=2787634 RepID=A0A934SLH3_9MICO|nr:Stk1 family PASTA domain-containing Ser/Thr kinase [Lacisediminihabitans changchengi]MBK4347743.1 Stk1 family PASTA domain-containing Ser/Thr kinase [Lacisediminihabitans changchengi]